MSERTSLITAAVEGAKGESDSRLFLRKFRQTYLTLLGVDASLDEGAAQAPYSAARLDRLRERLERSVATGAVTSGDPRPTIAFEHCVGLGELISPMKPGFDRSMVGVLIGTGVLTVRHGNDPPRAGFGADLKSVAKVNTVKVASCASHPQADARVTLLTNAAPVTECPMATAAEFNRATTGILVGFDGNEQRIEQELDIATCHRGRLAEWEFVAVALTSTMRTLGPGDSGSVFYINGDNGRLCAAGVLVREVPDAGCGPGGLFTRVDFVSQWALTLMNPFDR